MSDLSLLVWSQSPEQNLGLPMINALYLLSSKSEVYPFFPGPMWGASDCLATTILWRFLMNPHIGPY